MPACSSCAKWITSRKNAYDDGSEVVTFNAPEGKGACQVLGIDTPPEFGCNAFVEGAEHVEVTRKDGAPWQHFIMVPCPECTGIDMKQIYASPVGNRGHRCAGTGLVRLYDDGYVGDEQTRMHPKQKEYDEAQRLAAEEAKKRQDGPGAGQAMGPL